MEITFIAGSGLYSTERTALPKASCRQNARMFGIFCGSSTFFHILLNEERGSQNVYIRKNSKGICIKFTVVASSTFAFALQHVQLNNTKNYSAIDINLFISKDNSRINSGKFLIVLKTIAEKLQYDLSTFVISIFVITHSSQRGLLNLWIYICIFLSIVKRRSKIYDR